MCFTEIFLFNCPAECKIHDVRISTCAFRMAGQVSRCSAIATTHKIYRFKEACWYCGGSPQVGISPTHINDVYWRARTDYYTGSKRWQFIGQRIERLSKEMKHRCKKFAFWKPREARLMGKHFFRCPLHPPTEGTGSHVTTMIDFAPGRGPRSLRNKLTGRRADWSAYHPPYPVLTSYHAPNLGMSDYVTRRLSESLESSPHRIYQSQMALQRNVLSEPATESARDTGHFYSVGSWTYNHESETSLARYEEIVSPIWDNYIDALDIVMPEDSDDERAANPLTRREHVHAASLEPRTNIDTAPSNSQSTTSSSSVAIPPTNPTNSQTTLLDNDTSSIPEETTTHQKGKERATSGVLIKGNYENPKSPLDRLITVVQDVLEETKDENDAITLTNTTPPNGESSSSSAPVNIPAIDSTTSNARFPHELPGIQESETTFLLDDDVPEVIPDSEVSTLVDMPDVPENEPGCERGQEGEGTGSDVMHSDDTFPESILLTES